MRSTHQDDAIDGVVSKPEERDLWTIRKTSRVLEVVFFSIAGLFTMVLIVLIASYFVSGGHFPFSLGSFAAEALSAVGLIITSAILLVAGMIFRDISNGEAPFTAKQARRIRLIAWLLLAYALADSILPSGVIMATNIDETVLGVNRDVGEVPSIRLGTILVALVFFFLSRVFDYGVKLQELSDDVL